MRQFVARNDSGNWAFRARGNERNAIYTEKESVSVGLCYSCLGEGRMPPMSYEHHMMLQGSNFTTATTANAVTSSAFAVMPFKFGF